MRTRKTEKVKDTKKATRKLATAVASAAAAIESLSPNERIAVLACLVELFDAGYLDRGGNR